MNLILISFECFQMVRNSLRFLNKPLDGWKKSKTAQNPFMSYNPKILDFKNVSKRKSALILIIFQEL